MTPVDPSAQLAALIRSQVASLKKAAPRLKSNGKSPAKRNEDRDIASLVARRVSTIDADDPQRERKAFKVFLESVLIAELGEELANDPAFYAMVEEVQQQMEADPELAASMQKASRILLNPARQ